MDADTVWQIAAVGLAGLGIVWHQYWTTSKLRDRLVEVEQRLARIEGFLGIGMPPTAAPKAPREDLTRERPEALPRTEHRQGRKWAIARLRRSSG